MEINQFELIFQFGIRMLALLAATAVALHLARLLSRPRGTYGAGLPERRMRPRLVLRDPGAPQLREAVSKAA